MATKTADIAWQESILHDFTREIAASINLTVVGDPDNLFSETQLQEMLQKNGYELLVFEDPVSFRYQYESNYLAHSERVSAEHRSLVLVARNHIETLPYDILQTARLYNRVLSYSLANLFPKLTISVLAEVDRSDLDKLYHAYAEEAPPTPLGESQTCEYLLRHVYDVLPDFLKTPEDLLRYLLKRHYSGQTVPLVLDDWLIQQLGKKPQFKGWPLAEIIPDRANFFDFLQERWPIYLKKTFEGGCVGEGLAIGFNAEFSGPSDLPFGHSDIRVYIDNLFAEGFLKPVQVESMVPYSKEWASIGVLSEDESTLSNRFEKLTALVKEKLPAPGCRYEEWQAMAMRWAEWLALRWQLPAGISEKPELNSLHDEVEGAFAQWLMEHYGTLSNKLHWPKPVMVHHIPKCMAHGVNAHTDDVKKALIVIDGLSLDQWVLLRDDLKIGPDKIKFDEQTVFAWIPTLTSISRQTIFAAEAPYALADSLGSPAKEAQLWQRFWCNKGFNASTVKFVPAKQAESDASYLGRFLEVAGKANCHIVGAVLSVVDETMHGMTHGASGMHVTLKHWSQKGALRKLLTSLLDLGFEIHLTSDHGNLEGIGMGKPNVGVAAEERGERVHIFSDDGLRNKTRAEFPETIVWKDYGLPLEYKPLIAANRKAFTTKDRHVVGHGGISLEEVIVPYVRVTKHVA